MVDEGMRCDLILLFKMLIRVGSRGQQLQQGATDFPFLTKERKVCDHIWLIGGVSECMVLKNRWDSSRFITY